MIVFELIGRFVAGFLRGLIAPGALFVGLWVAFSCFGSWIMLADTDLPLVGDFSANLETTGGTVIEVGPEPLPDDPAPWRAISFRYSVNGIEYTKFSFATEGHYADGQAVTVEYSRRDPAAARIVGTSATPFGDELLLVLVFPALGAIMLVVLLFTCAVKGFKQAALALRQP